MVAADGVSTVYAALAVRAQHHKTLVVCFSMVNRANQDEYLRALQVYAHDVAKDLPANWLRTVQ